MSSPYGSYPSGQQDPNQQGSFGQQGPYGQQGGYGQQGPYGAPPQGQGQGQYAPYGSYQQNPYGGMPQGPYLQQGGRGFGPDSYLNGGGIGFGDAARLAFNNIFNYEGRASRSAYWWFALFAAVVEMAAFIVVGILGAIAGSGVFDALLILVFLALIPLFLAGLSLGVRRLHDSDKTGWLLLLSFIPFGGIAVLVLTLLPGTPGPNRFG
jgi:uncharacterized membrane protein YhaH (DUF805 family)